MGIVERLRNAIEEWERAQRLTQGDLRAAVTSEVGNHLRNCANRAADLIERLKRRAEHHWSCPSYLSAGAECLCGLTALIKEIEGE